MRCLNRSCLLSGLLLSSACLGTSTGNPTKDPDDGPGEVATSGGNNCKETSAMALSPDTQTALGFSAADLLAFVEGTREEKLTWHDQSGGFDYGPEHGEHGLTLRIVKKGAPRLVHYKPASSGGAEIALIGGGDCSDAIEIDLEVTLTTDQGALRETFETTIVARNATAVTLSASLEPSKLSGSFTAAKLPPNGKLTPLWVNIQLTKYGTSQGSVRTGVETRSSGSGVGGGTDGVSMSAQSRAPLADWGPADCEYHGVAVPNSAVVDGFSGDDVIALLNRAKSANVAFDGSAPATASLSFTAVNERACAVLPGNGYATIGGEGSLYVQAAMRIKSADGRIDATWPVAVTATAGASHSIERAELQFDDERLSQQGSFLERYGLTGIDGTHYDSTHANLMLTATANATLSGELNVTGFKNTPCQTVVTMDPNGGSSSSGCAGAMATTVAHALITAAAPQ